MRRLSYGLRYSRIRLRRNEWAHSVRNPPGAVNHRKVCHKVIASRIATPFFFTQAFSFTLCQNCGPQ
ncbi:hypothetical protein KPK_3391 [Klebsiella variicola]|uniref:Uncharacterized protein n=1 Tax=Klebsiella variicola (strain 342) TaxID=507522 RepID=B5XSL4_KLEV3|nr:hypothetical protein KPK_3391 [Klebsiella variicola]